MGKEVERWVPLISQHWWNSSLVESGGKITFSCQSCQSSAPQLAVSSCHGYHPHTGIVIWFPPVEQMHRGVSPACVCFSLTPHQSSTRHFTWLVVELSYWVKMLPHMPLLSVFSPCLSFLFIFFLFVWIFSEEKAHKHEERCVCLCVFHLSGVRFPFLLLWLTAVRGDVAGNCTGHPQGGESRAWHQPRCFDQIWDQQCHILPWQCVSDASGVLCLFMYVCFISLELRLIYLPLT